MSQKNPHAEALQNILVNEIGRRLFSSFPLHNNASFANSQALKAEATMQMLNEKTYPSIILSDIDSEEKKEMFIKALEINVENMKEAFNSLVDFMIEKQKQFPKMKELWNHLETIAPKKEKK